MIEKKAPNFEKSAFELPTYIRQNIFFNISCTVESTIPDTYLAWGLEGSGLKFENLVANGKVVDTQIKLPKGDSTLEIRRFWYSSSDASITILNIDYSGALTIKQCHADPVVSN